MKLDESINEISDLAVKIEEKKYDIEYLKSKIINVKNLFTSAVLTTSCASFMIGLVPYKLNELSLDRSLQASLATFAICGSASLTAALFAKLNNNDCENQLEEEMYNLRNLQLRYDISRINIEYAHRNDIKNREDIIINNYVKKVSSSIPKKRTRKKYKI